MRSRYKITGKEGVYFLTGTIVEWLPVFTSEKYFHIFVESLKFCRREKGLKIYAYVILDNHFHMLAAAPELSKTLASLKKITASKTLQALKIDGKKWLLNQFAYFKKSHKVDSNYQVWQEGSHPQLIVNREMLTQKIEYIHNNPVKRGLVDLPEHWRFSSARNYESGDQTILEIDPLPI